ncbi:MAG: sugar phosphate isomerase/epimerase [Deltaproteobacteria bacterium]|nr:sugar phosphate isomerase/epimerase [Deltaproteobacteria bacterium]
MMNSLTEKIQINIPFTMLTEGYLDLFVQQGLNPEIGFDATALDRFSLSDFSGIAEQFHRAGLTTTLHAPFVDLSPGSTDPHVRAVTRNRFEQILQLVPLFQPKAIVCHIGYDDKRYWYFKDLWVENSVEMWSWLGQSVQAEGALLMLENVYEHGPNDIRVLFERLENQGIRFCLDTGHQAVFGHVSLETWVDSLGPYLGQLHLHDNSGAKDDHLAMGRGTVDFQALFKQLRAMRKDPPLITLEPHREEDFRPSIEYLEKIWPW